MKIYIYILGIFLHLGCGHYSFSGASIPSEIKTVEIGNFVNRSGKGPVLLSQQFVDALKLKFQNETSLNIVDKKGDIVFKGAITGYDFQSIAPTGNTTSDFVRLTISVEVIYTNHIFPEESWKKTFSRYADYSSTQNLLDIEGELVSTIYALLTDEIFNQALVKW